MHKPRKPPSDRELLVATHNKLEHLHQMIHRVENKVDYLTEVAGSDPNDAEQAARIREMAQKLKSQIGDLKEAVEETGA